MIKIQKINDKRLHNSFEFNIYNATIWRRLGEWRKKERKKKNHSYKYRIYIAFMFTSLKMYLTALWWVCSVAITVNNCVRLKVCVFIYVEKLLSYKQKKIKLRNIWHFVENKKRDYAACLKDVVNCLVAYVQNEFLGVFSYTRLMSTTETDLSQLLSHSIIIHTTATYTDLLTGMKVAYFIHGML